MTEGDQLERGLHRFGAHVVVRTRTRPCLIDVLASEDTERDRHGKRRRKLGERSRDGMREDVEVGGLAPDQAAKRHHRVETAGPREKGHGGWELEGARHLELLDLGPCRERRLHRPFGQRAGHILVPARTHDRHSGPPMEILSPSRSLPRGGHLSQSSPRMRHCRVSK
jgi:hypothetical protein